MTRGNGRGYRRRDDRPSLPVIAPDPNAPHSIVVKAQNRAALDGALKAQIKKTTANLLKGKTK